MPFVYILESSKGLLYIGSTVNLKRRLNHHQNGHTKSTKKMGSLNLIFSQEYPTLSDARSIEKRLKQLKRRDYILKIIADGAIRMKP